MENVAVSGNFTYIRHRSETNVIRDYQRLMKTCNLSNSITDVDYLVHYIVKEFEFVAYYYGKGMAQFC